MELNRKNHSFLNYFSRKIAKKFELCDVKALNSARKLEIVDKYIREIIDKEKIIISEREIAGLIREICEDSFGFGPVSYLMDNDEVTEIMINNYDEVYIEENGIIKKTKVKFKSNSYIKNLVEKILSPLGLRVDESSPMADARLDDGSRINVVLSPVSLNDMVVTIRKFRKKIIDMESLEKMGTLSRKVSDFIRLCVQAKLNIIVSGATSTGKTTFLNVISNFIPAGERIITIEDTLELSLNLQHVVKLESRPPNIEGKGEITIRDLVRNSLRMRPDRIIVGEIRGAEAVDVLQAMNTGHNGSMATVHANSPTDLISRLETMLLMAGLNLNPDSARRMIASSVDMIIHLERLTNGRRLLSGISEIASGSGSMGSNAVLEVRDIFNIKNKSLSSDNGYETGDSIIFTGYRPTFIAKIKNAGFDFNFKDGELG
mgnify:CR=1 FL=1